MGICLPISLRPSSYDRMLARKEKEMAKAYTESEMAAMGLEEARSIIRRGDWTEKVIRICVGYAKFNLVVLPKEMAFEFLVFSQRNPACAVSEATDIGDPHPKILAPEADLRTDLSRYRVFKDGELIDEPTDVTKYWRDDLVAFLIGAAPNLIVSLQKANIEHKLLGDYTSNIATVPAGRFRSPHIVVGFLVKSNEDAVRAIQISSRLPVAHFAPLHIGDPGAIGIHDIAEPDVLAVDPVDHLEPGEVSLFWGTGLTPQKAAVEAKIPFMITHKAGHVFISDRRVEELASF